MKQSMNAQYFINILNNIFAKIEFCIFNLKDRFPNIGRLLAFGWHIVYRIKIKIEKKAIQIKAKIQYGNDIFDFDKIYWINPHKIKNYITVKLDKRDNYSRIISGNWDRSIKTFEELSVYKAFIKRFKEGKKWEETQFYNRVLNEVISSKEKWGCNNKQALDARFRGLDLLYKEIKKNGYKSQKEIYSSKRLFEKLEKHVIDNEVAIAIGRGGQILFVDGRHRLSIAKMLNIPKIPVMIATRHKKWIDFKKELYYFSKSRQSEKLYQTLTHPDLQDIPFLHGDTRYNMIKENISHSKGTLLDIGANLGYFCHKFEDDGFDCFAVENNPIYKYFLRKLKKSEEKKFKIISESIFDYKKDQDLNFDVVLALNIFHHFLKTKENYINLINLLKRIKTNEFFFGAHLPKQLQKINAYRNYNPDEFVDIIINNSCLNKSKLLGKTSDGRSLFKLSK